MIRDQRIDALLALFTCPHCGEIKERDRLFNSERICADCHGRACAGYRRRIDVRDGVPRPDAAPGARRE